MQNTNPLFIKLLLPLHAAVHRFPKIKGIHISGYSVTNCEKRLMVTVAMQVDAAADVSVMSEQVACSIPALIIEPSDKVLKH